MLGRQAIAIEYGKVPTKVSKKRPALWRFPPTAEACLEHSCDKPCSADFEPLDCSARTVLDQWRGILRWSTTRMSKVLVDDFNSLIQAAKVNARGYRITQGILHMAYLKCANLNLPT